MFNGSYLFKILVFCGEVYHTWKPGRGRDYDLCSQAGPQKEIFKCYVICGTKHKMQMRKDFQTARAKHETKDRSLATVPVPRPGSSLAYCPDPAVLQSRDLPPNLQQVPGHKFKTMEWVDEGIPYFPVPKSTGLAMPGPSICGFQGPETRSILHLQKRLIEYLSNILRLSFNTTISNKMQTCLGCVGFAFYFSVHKQWLFKNTRPSPKTQKITRFTRNWKASAIQNLGEV